MTKTYGTYLKFQSQDMKDKKVKKDKKDSSNKGSTDDDDVISTQLNMTIIIKNATDVITSKLPDINDKQKIEFVTGLDNKKF